ncbi:uncharacterized protein LOC110688368 [Chenopodium quinoa]|uniref:uncharacterized protein LOC110688368 n=1 Tax=Chenopodium quinoa TaxID=63459 RepID=UPI000B78E7AA|nr:uncharacterized protein LOC110688368 [Chenopodium quinoa]
MVHEENVHEENNKEHPLEEYEERMGRLKNVSTLLAELVQDSRKKKNTNKEDSASMFKKFSSLNPPSYDGKLDPVEFEDWINRMDQLFETLRCPERIKVDFATFYLTSQASLWWKVNKERKNESGFSWTKLQELMRYRFYPLSLRRQKEDEFLHLQQGTMSVLDYANKFMELSRFAPELVSTEQSRMNRFERGLHLKYQDRLSSQRFTSYQDMVDVAVNVERVVLLREAQNVGYKRRNDNQNQGGTKRQNQSQQGGYSGNRGQGQQGGNKNQNNRSQVVYAKCGRRSHNENECGVGTNTCYRCGSPSHYIKDCPKFITVTPISKGPAPSGADRGRNNTNTGGTNRNLPRPPITGRVYVMRQDEAANDDTVITGNFSIHSSHAHVLFDSAASHSFISPIFANILQLKPYHDFIGMSVSLPTGETVKCGTMYRDCPIILEGVKFPVNLIAFDLCEFDIILGMDWLTKHEAKIDCVEQSLTLKAPNG